MRIPQKLRARVCTRTSRREGRLARTLRRELANAMRRVEENCKSALRDSETRSLILHLMFIANHCFVTPANNLLIHKHERSHQCMRSCTPRWRAHVGVLEQEKACFRLRLVQGDPEEGGGMKMVVGSRSRQEVGLFIPDLVQLHRVLALLSKA